MGDEYIDFSSSVDQVETAAALMKSAFICDDNVHWDAVEVALRAQVNMYFESQKHLGGNCQRIRFQRVALVASRYNPRMGLDTRIYTWRFFVRRSAVILRLAP